MLTAVDGNINYINSRGTKIWPETKRRSTFSSRGLINKSMLLFKSSFPVPIYGRFCKFLRSILCRRKLRDFQRYGYDIFRIGRPYIEVVHIAVFYVSGAKFRSSSGLKKWIRILNQNVHTFVSVIKKNGRELKVLSDKTKK